MLQKKKAQLDILGVLQLLFNTASTLILSAHLIERTPDIDGAVLDDFVHDFRDRLGEVRVGKLGSKAKKEDVLCCAVCVPELQSHTTRCQSDVPDIRRRSETVCLLNMFDFIKT